MTPSAPRSPKRVPIVPVLGGLGALYVILIVAFSTDQLKHDEHRYFDGAHKLTKGTLVSEEHPEFANGPGYPLLLTPVMSLLGFDFDELIQSPEDYEWRVPGPDGRPIEESLKWRLLPLRLPNALFLVAGLLMFFRAARLFVSDRTALILVIVLGLNPYQLRWLHAMMTESLTPLIFGSFAWAYAKALRADRFSWKYILLAGALFGYLALTRTIFGYVATTALVLLPLFCLCEGKKHLVLRAASPMALALVFCIPYLAITHHHTGRLFCWATNGDELLYWITSPHEGEYGNWTQEKWLVEDPVLAERHLDFIRHVFSLPPLERKEVWMEGVRENLQAEGIGKALARNYLANVSRAIFGSPRTRQDEGFAMLIRILIGAVFLTAAMLALYPTLRCWRKLPIEIKLLMTIAMIDFGGSLLLPTGPRYWIPILPAVALWMGYVFERFVSVRIRVGPKEEPNLSQISKMPSTRRRKEDKVLLAQ